MLSTLFWGCGTKTTSTDSPQTVASITPSATGTPTEVPTIVPTEASTIITSSSPILTSEPLISSAPIQVSTDAHNKILGTFRVKADEVVKYDTTSGELTYQIAGGHFVDEYYNFKADGSYTTNAYGHYETGTWHLGGQTIELTTSKEKYSYTIAYDQAKNMISIYDSYGAGGVLTSSLNYYKNQPVTYSWAIEPKLAYDAIAFEPTYHKFIGIKNSNGNMQQYVISSKTGALTGESLPSIMNDLMMSDENRTDITDYAQIFGVAKNNKYVFVSRNDIWGDKGQQTLSYKFDGIVSIDGEMAFVKYKGKWGIVRKW